MKEVKDLRSETELFHGKISGQLKAIESKTETLKKKIEGIEGTNSIESIHTPIV